MKDESKTKKQLINEIEELRGQLARVQSSDAEFQQMKESNEKFVKAFLQNSIPMDITLLRNGRYVDVSEAFLRFLGLKRSEVIGNTATELKLITAEQKAIFINELNSKGRVENLELQVKTKGGELRDGLFNAVMMTLNNEKYLLTVMADITERNQAQAALVKSEEKLRLITENIVDCIAFVDTAGTYQYVTPSYKETLGYSPGEMVGYSGFSYTHPDDLERVLGLCMEAVEQGRRELSYETRLRHKNGHYVPIEMRARSIKDQQGKIIGGVLAARDITSRRQAEEALRKSEEKYRNILERIEDGYYEIDHTGTLTFFNDSLCRMLGYSQDEALGLNYRQFMHKENSREVFETFNRVYKTGKAAKALPWKLITKEGTELFIENSISLKLDKEGRPTGFQGIARDITERKMMEDKLKENEEKFRILMESSPTAFLLYQNNTWIYANPAAMEITGYTGQELRDMSFAHFAHPDDKDILQDRAQKRQKGEIKTNLRYEVRIIRKDGTIKWIDLSSATIFLKGSPAGIVSVVDITEGKRMAAELLKARKLESVATLAGGLAHDFNNLLAGIHGYIEMAKMDISADSRAHEYLLAAEKSAKQAAGLTRRLITFARGEEPLRKQCDMGEFIKDAVQKALMEIPVEKKVIITENLWPAEVDEAQMRQVITNIIANAVEAIPDGGLLTVRAQNIKVSGPNQLPVSEGSYVRLAVSDTGEGIAAEDLPLIFDPYFSKKQRGTQKGMGLGLSVCHSIVSKHGGYITVESAPGQGSSFYIYLPAIIREKSVESMPRQEGIPGVQKRILVMDDEEVIREMMQELLKTMGCQVTTAQDGLSAIDLYVKARAADQSYDMVILDLTVKGGMGGVQAMKRLREVDPEVKAIIFSGYTDDPAIENYSQYGFRGALTKPFNREGLKAILENNL